MSPSPPSRLVSKTDVIGFHRCPYAWWLVDQGELVFNETLDEFTRQLVARGGEFHAAVEDAATPLQVGDLRAYVASSSDELPLLGIDTITHRRRGLIGRPDGIIPAGGAALPVEIKSHRTVTRSDELELAFYWLLLSDLRTVKDAEPRGVLILLDAGEERRVDVELSLRRFDEVTRLIAGVRAARAGGGVVPRVCGCRVCSVLRRDQVRRLTTRHRHITMVDGIGPIFSEDLAELGVRTWQQMGRADPEVLWKVLDREDRYVGWQTITRWQHHAAAYKQGGPVVFGEPPGFGEEMLALDLEYGPDPEIWLAGVSVVQEGRGEFQAFWSNGPRGERRLLQEVAELVAQYPTFPVVTWGGKSAELPQLRDASARLNLKGLFDALYERHMDAYWWAWRTLRVPVPSFSLKEIGDYVGYRRLSPITGGLEAQLERSRFLASRSDRTRSRTRRRLVEYNRDDVEALVHVCAELRRIVAETPRVAISAEPEFVKQRRRERRAAARAEAG